MKGIFIGSTIQEVQPRLKKVYQNSALTLDSTTQLSENQATGFTLAESLKSVGDYPLDRFLGYAYQDTIYYINNNNTEWDHEESPGEDLRAANQDLETENEFTMRWPGDEVRIYYNSYKFDDQISAVWKIQHQAVARKLFEEPDLYEPNTSDDF